ncbi:junctional adhesion molecule A isoform X1 [Mustela nigripes]|uniref:junctional adhesion molecule A isoform X1 n=1 Tax=Mustela nigripes TaxID=77151 RepID=UPI002814F0FE|nr:junctional adhesion molecule A isoform X1 [Mustela nigripes]
MGTEARAGRKQLLLFTSVILCSALSRGAVYTSDREVSVAENKPAKLSCSYSGFSSPRVEWKFAQGDITSLVCYNNKITASYEDRVTFSHSGITFHSVTRKDTGTYTCMVSDEGGNTYGEVTVKLVVLVPPSKPTVSIPSSATIGSRAVLTCSEKDGSPPSEFSWYKDGVMMPTDPKSSRAFSNSSYSLDHKTGELVFNPVSASDSGEYMCQAQNGHGTPMRSDAVRMEAAELNVGGIVAAVLVTLILLGFLILGIWFAYRRGYFDRPRVRRRFTASPVPAAKGSSDRLRRSWCDPGPAHLLSSVLALRWCYQTLAHDICTFTECLTCLLAPQGSPLLS